MIRYLAAIACCLVITSNVQAQKITPKPSKRSADGKKITVEGAWDNQGALFGGIKVWYKKKGDATFTQYVSPDVNFTDKTYKGEITGLDPKTDYTLKHSLYTQKDTMSPTEETSEEEEVLQPPQGGSQYRPRSSPILEFWCRQWASPGKARGDCGLACLV